MISIKHLRTQLFGAARAPTEATPPNFGAGSDDAHSELVSLAVVHDLATRLLLLQELGSFSSGSDCHLTQSELHEDRRPFSRRTH